MQCCETVPAHFTGCAIRGVVTAGPDSSAWPLSTSAPALQFHPMCISRLMLRVFLSLVLILNGTGYAAAASNMHMSHIASISHEAAPPVMAMEHGGEPEPCHEDTDTFAGDLPGSSHVQGGVPDLPHGQGPEGAGCCDAEQCAGVCAQHLSAAVSSTSTHSLAVLHAASIGTMSAGHASPALADPMRPPIA